MQWTAKEAHLQMQIPAKVMTSDLEQTLRYQYLRFRNEKTCNKSHFTKTKMQLSPYFFMLSQEMIFNSCCRADMKFCFNNSWHIIPH